MVRGHGFRARGLHPRPGMTPSGVLVLTRRRVAVTWGRRVPRRRVIGRWRGSAGGHTLCVIGVVLLLQVCRRALGIGSTGAAADDRARGRADTGAAAAADGTADSSSDPCPQKSAAESLGIHLVTQRGDLLVGILPASLVIIIGLRHRAGAREDRQDHTNETRTHHPNQRSLLHKPAGAVENSDVRTLTLRDGRPLFAACGGVAS